MPESFNRYAYVANNPYKYVDPDGKDPLVTGIAGALLGGAQGLYEGGYAGAALGGLIGYGVGVIDPAASEAVAGAAVEACNAAGTIIGDVVETTARALTSSVVQTGGNIAYDATVKGQVDLKLDITSGFAGGSMGAGTNIVAKEAFSADPILGGYLSKAFSPSMQERIGENSSVISGDITNTAVSMKGGIASQADNHSDSDENHTSADQDSSSHDAGGHANDHNN